MQDPDNNNNISDREDFKGRISMPISNPDAYTNSEDAGLWSDSVGGYQVPSEQAELRYDGGRGTDY